MTSQPSPLRIIALVLLGSIFLVMAVGQTCSEFPSPKSLTVEGSKVGYIGVPVEGNQYDSNQLCQWVIEAEPGLGVELEVLKCSLQGTDILGECASDYVDVFDMNKDSSDLLGRFCGSDTGQVYRTTGNKMAVDFRSNMNFEYRGFNAAYRSFVLDSPSEDSTTLGLAVGIPLGVLAVGLVVVVSVCCCRRYQHQKAAAGDNQSYSGSCPGSCPSLSAPRVCLSCGSNHHTLGASCDQADIAFTDSSVHPDAPYDHVLYTPAPYRRYSRDEFHTPANRAHPFHEGEAPRRTTAASQNLQAPNPPPVPPRRQAATSAEVELAAWLATLPPAYETLDFEDNGRSELLLAPPPYEMVVKVEAYLGSTTV